MGVVRVEKWGIEAAGDFEPAPPPRDVLARPGGPRRKTPCSNEAVPDGPRRVSLEGFLVQCVRGVPLTASWTKKRHRYCQSQPRCQECQGPRVSIRAEALEESFVDLLKKLQPEPEPVRIFKEEVLNVWKQAQKQA